MREGKNTRPKMYVQIRKMLLLGIVIALLPSLGISFMLNLIHESRSWDQTLSGAAQVVANSPIPMEDIQRAVRNVPGIEVSAVHDRKYVPMAFYALTPGADATATIEAFMRLGVADYLIKPFGHERFQLALKTFCNRRGSLPRPSWTPPYCRSLPPKPGAPPCLRACRARPWSSSRTICARAQAKDTPATTSPVMRGCRWSQFAGT